MSDHGSSLRRRSYLSLVGAGALGLAGCRSSESAGGNDGTTVETTTATTTTGQATTTQTRTTEQPTTTEQTTTTEATTEESAVAEMESELADVSFEGEYFDTHAHWLPSMGRNVPSQYAARMETHDIGATVLFSPSRMADTDYRGFLERLTDPGVEYLPFMSAPPPGRNLPRDLSSLYENAGPAFWGMGEWKPQRQPSPEFDGERLTRLWQTAAGLDIPVMYHPQADQEGQVEPALADNPDTTFLLHGFQMMGYGQEQPGLGPTLPRLLSAYDNLHWTMDFATMTDGSLVAFRSGSRFHDWYDANADEMIRVFQNILSDLLEAAPDRVMWGTDVAQPWNLTDDRVFERVMEFTEEVLAGVPSEHHDAFRYQNALDVFGL